jgi:hypothetical protein
MESVMKDETIPNKQRGIRSDPGGRKSNRGQECEQAIASTDVAIWDKGTVRNC